MKILSSSMLFNESYQAVNFKRKESARSLLSLISRPHSKRVHVVGSFSFFLMGICTGIILAGLVVKLGGAL